MPCAPSLLDLAGATVLGADRLASRKKPHFPVPRENRETQPNPDLTETGRDERAEDPATGPGERGGR
jgi:hypothetical protein